ncbi:hypothetical protein [Pantoea stewartii]|uniref:hypothetical protein n=1 Tax=Pantoea stewartii TaxID=66269 RepID=UPI00345C0CE4
MNDKFKLKALPVIIITTLFLLLFCGAGALSNIRDYYTNNAKLEDIRNAIHSTCSVLVLMNPLDEPAGERRAHLQEDIDSCKKQFSGEL